jgi:hypothetical protein
MRKCRRKQLGITENRELSLAARLSAEFRRKELGIRK